VQLAYANPGQVEGTRLSPGWLVDNNPYRIGSGHEDKLDGIRRYWETWAAATRILLRALAAHDVRVVAGTDSGNAMVVPGFSLHDELAALVDAGMTPTQALRAATRNPADWIGTHSGRIAPGQQADLLLLTADPLEDIAATRRIDAVIMGGRIYERHDLDAMLDAVRRANEAGRTRPLPVARDRSNPASATTPTETALAD